MEKKGKLILLEESKTYYKKTYKIWSILDHACQNFKSKIKK